MKINIIDWVDNPLTPTDAKWFDMLLLQKKQTGVHLSGYHIEHSGQVTALEDRVT